MMHVALVSIVVIVFGLGLMYADYRASIGRRRKGPGARKQSLPGGSH